jgi:hypothetical protein
VTRQSPREDGERQWAITVAVAGRQGPGTTVRHVDYPSLPGGAGLGAGPPVAVLGLHRAEEGDAAVITSSGDPVLDQPLVGDLGVFLREP